MKLYLSSYRIPTLKEFIDLVGKNPEQTKIAILPNAKDYYSDHVRNIKAKEILGYFLSHGFRAEIVDLSDYSVSSSLKNCLQKFDVIWASGGNTFCLRYEMQRSEFDLVIKDLVDHGVIYSGESAGAIVAGNSLADIELADEPEFSEKIIYEGLKLIDSYILPHVGNPKFESANIAAQLKHGEEPGYIELTDYQAYIVNGDTAKIVTAP